MFHLNLDVSTQIQFGSTMKVNTHTWGRIRRYVRRTSVSSGKTLTACGFDQSAPAPPSGWRCWAEIQSPSPETERHKERKPQITQMSERTRRKRLHGHVYTPCLQRSLEETPRCPAPCAVQPWPQHSYSKTKHTPSTNQLHPDQIPVTAWQKNFNPHLTTVCVQTMNSGREFHWW